MKSTIKETLLFSLKKYLSVLLVILSIVAVFSSCGGNNEHQNISDEQQGISDLEIDISDPCVTIYDNGNSVYQPNDENAHFDSVSKEVYYDNLLYVFLAPGLSKNQIVSLADSVDGYVCSKITTGLSFVQIKVDSTDLNSMKEKVEILNKSEDVILAGYEFPNAFSLTDTNTEPWNSDPNKPDKNINSDTPNGNDWWAEAIGAYKAWEYSDLIEDYCNVGIIDSGFNLNHEDLSGNLKMEEGITNTPHHHGTHVAGLMVAKNNGVGIRGVADKSTAYCIDYDSVSYTNIGNIVNIYASLISQKIRVINFSICSGYYLSKSNFAEEKYKDRMGDGWGFILQLFVNEEYGAYEEYMDIVHPLQTGMAAIGTIASLIAYDNDDFIIVQSAGNGIDNGGKGINAYLNGDFCSINEDLFNLYYSEKKAFCDKYKINYDVIADHKIVVGAVKNKTDSSGNYLSCKSSNYGDTVDIFAPGEDIFSTYYNEKKSDEENRKLYKKLDGTSMAAPIVSGSVALLWSAAPNLSAGKIKACLINNIETHAVGVGDDEGTLYPMLNIGKAFESQGLTVVLNEESDLSVSPEYEETSTQNGNTAPNASDAAKVVETFVKNRKAWEPISVYSYNPNAIYSFLDLDGDGKKELVWSFTEGSGRFSTSSYFTVDSSSETVKEIMGSNGNDDLYSEVDWFGMKREERLFVNKATGKYLFYISNGTNGGTEGYAVDYGTFEFSNGEYYVTYDMNQYYEYLQQGGLSENPVYKVIENGEWIECSKEEAVTKFNDRYSDYWEIPIQISTKSWSEITPDLSDEELYNQLLELYNASTVDYSSQKPVTYESVFSD